MFILFDSAQKDKKPLSPIKVLDFLIEPTLKITKEEFITKRIFDLNLDISSYSIYNNKKIDILYRYYLFACYLITQKIASNYNYILSKTNKFKYDKNDFL